LIPVEEGENIKEAEEEEEWELVGVVTREVRSGGDFCVGGK
jgi:hypothetical protein